MALDATKPGSAALPDGFWSLTPPGRRLDGAGGVGRLLGLAPDRAADLDTLEAACTPAARDRLAAALQAALADGTPWDLTLDARDGDRRPLRLRCRGLAVVEGGRTVRLVGTLDRLPDAPAAADSALLDGILENMGEGIVVFDAGLRLVAWNRRWLELTMAVPLAVHRGMALRDILVAQLRAGEFGPSADPEADADDRIARYWRAIAAPVTLERTRPDGSALELRRSPIAGGGFVTLYVDVTARRRAEAAAARSARLLEHVIENIPAVVFLKDPVDHRYLSFNRMGEMLDGRPRAAIVGRTDAELFPPDQAAIMLAGDVAAMAQDGPVEVPEQPVCGADGRVRWMHVVKQLLREADGGPAQILGVSVDMTARHEAEAAVRRANEELTRRVAERTAALAASEERTRRIIDTAPDAVITTDATGRVTGWNPRAEAMFDRPAADVMGRPLAELVIPPEGRARFRAGLRRFSRAGRIGAAGHRVELIARRRDGVHFVAALSMTRVTVDGAPWLSGFVSDVTARKAVEGELHVARLNLQDAIESMDHGLALFDPDDRLVLCNATFLDHFHDIADLLRPGAAFESIFRAAVARGSIPLPAGEQAEPWIQQRLAIHRRAGPETQPRILKDGRILEVTKRRSRAGGTLSIGTDVTARRAMEEQLREAQKMEAIGKLTGGMAHDFNNYLGTIIGNLDLAADRARADARLARLIEAALAGALSAAELTRSLLAFARRQALDPRPIDVNRRVEAIAGLLGRTLGEDVQLDTRLTPRPWRVRIDAAQLDSCLVNLANNARDAMPAGGRLTIATANVTLGPDAAPAAPAAPAASAASGEHVLIEVADTGEGMAPETLAQVFEPFFTTKGPGHGTGLGLSMVYGFVKQSGGQIGIDSVPGRGTVVRLWLPRDPAGDEADGDAGPAESPAPGGRETVLVVEDNPQMRAAAAAQLGALGYAVIEAGGGAEALALLGDPARRIDLLFSDVVMPGGLDGNLLARLARERRPGLPVLLTSGYPGERQAARPADVPLLQKPYRKAALAQAVRAAIDAAAAPPVRD